MQSDHIKTVRLMTTSGRKVIWELGGDIQMGETGIKFWGTSYSSSSAYKETA